MPIRPPRAHTPGHAPQPRPRVSARARGYDVEWERERKAFLALHPWCECPDHVGKPDAPPSDTVDHIVAHKGNKALFRDRSNWRASTRACNSAKCAREEGGFGNRRRAGAAPPRREAPQPAPRPEPWGLV